MLVGEGTWTFDRSSDGGDRGHSVPIAPGTKTVTATYKMTGAGRPIQHLYQFAGGSQSRRAPGSGKFGSANDIDWYRFKLTATTRVRLVLGDLATPAG